MSLSAQKEATSLFKQQRRQSLPELSPNSLHPKGTPAMRAFFDDLLGKGRSLEEDSASPEFTGARVLRKVRNAPDRLGYGPGFIQTTGAEVHPPPPSPTADQAAAWAHLQTPARSPTFVSATPGEQEEERSDFVYGRDWH
jgi:hypothetical protein